MNGLPSICSYEDRPENLVGWKLLLASMHQYSPDLPVYLFSKAFPKAFEQWVNRRCPNVSLIRLSSKNLLGWNNKPLVIQHLFDLGIESVLWVDSDMILTRDIIPRLREIPSQTVAVTLENGQYDERRITCHGWTPARQFPGNLNTSLIQVHKRYHKDLILRWKNTLEGSYFQKIQRLSHEERPIYCWSEQDVFAGLLCAKPPEGFSNLTMKPFVLNQDIVHAGSPNRMKDRLYLLKHSLPYFVHAQGLKPWNLENREMHLTEIQVELSLYLHIAQRFSSQLDEETPWLHPRSFRGKLFHRLFWGNPHLRGMPPLLLNDVKNGFRRNTVK